MLLYSGGDSDSFASSRRRRSILTAVLLPQCAQSLRCCQQLGLTDQRSLHSTAVCTQHHSIRSSAILWTWCVQHVLYICISRIVTYATISSPFSINSLAAFSLHSQGVVGSPDSAHIAIFGQWTLIMQLGQLQPTISIQY